MLQNVTKIGSYIFFIFHIWACVRKMFLAVGESCLMGVVYEVAR